MADFAHDTHFSRLIQGQIHQMDLAAVALEIARDEYPDLEIANWLARLDGMGDAVRRRVAADREPEALIRHINQFLFDEQGYRGNTEEYYDPRNSFLNEVMERKLGIPITLSLIYLAVADRIGLRLQGVGMPAHFIVKFVGSQRELFIDPFDGGKILNRDTCELRVSQVLGVPVSLDREQLEPSPHDQVVLRLLGNLKGIYAKQADFARALRVQERICAVHQDPAECRDLGVLYLRNDRPSKAMEQLEAYCRMRPEAEDLETIRTLLQGAARLQASMN